MLGGMPYSIPDTEPTALIAGDTATWSKSLADFPASAGWALTYTLINAAGKISIAASASGDDHLVEVAPATTADWVAGRYQWLAHVTLGAARHTVGSGTMEVKPNLAAATTYDARSHARKMLEAIEAALEARATSAHLDVITSSYPGMSITRDKDKLIRLRDLYRREVRAEEDAERLAQGLPSRNKILVRI